MPEVWKGRRLKTKTCRLNKQVGRITKQTRKEAKLPLLLSSWSIYLYHLYLGHIYEYKSRVGIVLSPKVTPSYTPSTTSTTPMASVAQSQRVDDNPPTHNKPLSHFPHTHTEI